MEYLKSIGIVYLRPYWQNVFSQSFKKELFLNFYLLTVLFLGGRREMVSFEKIYNLSQAVTKNHHLVSE